jgi:hypothetical protein
LYAGAFGSGHLSFAGLAGTISLHFAGGDTRRKTNSNPAQANSSDSLCIESRVIANGRRGPACSTDRASTLLWAQLPAVICLFADSCHFWYDFHPFF